MRTHHCASITESTIGERVRLCGWVNSRRDHGGVVFIDLRDSSGIMQIVVNPEPELQKIKPPPRESSRYMEFVVNPNFEPYKTKPSRNKHSFALAESVRNEYVLQIEGVVRERPEGTENLGISTGEN